MIAGKREDHLIKLEERWKKRLNGVLDVFRSEPYFLEVVPNFIDKANTLGVLLEKLSVKPEEIMAIGDGVCDFSMIQLAGLGVAMGNAQDSVKACADIVTTSNDEDGVALAVENNILAEIHPSEIAFDMASMSRALAAVNNHPRFGINFDPSHLGYQGVDYIKLLRHFGERIFHVHMKDVWWGKGDGSVGVFGGHTSFGDARRYWDFRSLGRGMIDFEAIIAALNDIQYEGALSVEWEDARMDRIHGATEAAAFCRRLDFPSSKVIFDAAFEK